MSGGALDYLSFYSVIDDLKDRVKNNRIPIPFNELDEYDIRDWTYEHNKDFGFPINKSEYDKDPKLYYNYSDDTILYIKESLKALEIAQAYHKSIDYLLSGDIRDCDFRDFLNNELPNQETE